MEQVPDFWRTEVWHPLSVHFPIVLLLVGTLAYLFSLLLKNQKQQMWDYFSRFLLVAGTVAAWIAIYTGGLADGIVSRKICDPTVLKSHETSAYTLSILFSIAVVLLFVQDFSFPKIARKFVQLLIVGLLLTGSGYLFYTGHLGASVVYQQGGGVYHPSPNCQEFE